jgi:hypothetical protein
LGQRSSPFPGSTPHDTLDGQTISAHVSPDASFAQIGNDALGARKHSSPDPQFELTRHGSPGSAISAQLPALQTRFGVQPALPLHTAPMPAGVRHTP